MAWAKHVYIINPEDEEIFVEHIFYGDTKDEAEQVEKEHLGSCEYFRAAEQEGRTDSWWEKDVDRPTVDDKDDK